MRNSIAILVLAVVLVLTATACVSAQDANPISVLQSDASIKDKAEACRTLALQGGRETVPVLAAMLEDEKLSHMARGALEPMPCSEAGAALRDALGKTTGRIKVGIVNSLAIRRDKQAVPELIKLLSDGDVAVAQAAAESLGVIATPEATKALEDALAQPAVAPANLEALCDGLFKCAEKLEGQREQTIAIYDLLLKVPNTSCQVHAGALRGAVLTRGPEQGLPLLLEAFRAENEDGFAAALRISRELKGEETVTAALAELLPVLAVERKVRFIEALGARGGQAAGPAVLAEVKEGSAEIRVAALRALTRMSYSPALKLMEELAGAEDVEVAKAAQNSLSYFHGAEGDAALGAMLNSEQAATRRIAVELIGRGGLDKPVVLLMKAAETDADESVRVAALGTLRDSAGIEEMPRLLDNLLKARSQPEMQAAEKVLGALCERQKRTATGGVVIQKALYGSLPDGPSADVSVKVTQIVASGSRSVDASNSNFGDTAPGLVKKLRIDYTDNGTALSKTVKENETLKLAIVSAPAVVVDAFCSALDNAQGEAKLAMLRLVGATGSTKALDAVRAAAAADDATIKEMALRTLCEWPTPDALPTLMEMAKTSPDATLKVLALRGAVRLLGQTNAATTELLGQYAALMDGAGTADEKKSVLGGLAQVQDVGAMELAMRQFADESVKAEAVQAAIAIAKNLGKSAREDATFFNGKDLTGWQGSEKYWQFDDGVIVGLGKEPPAKNEFIWSNVEVRDFYLVVDVKLEPNSGNGGVQFRSKKVDERGTALGYQADAGQDVWGRLYHEHGRGKLDWTDTAEKAVVPGEWNHCEILAVGPAIWIALNGKLGAAYLEKGEEGERSGLIAAQLHAGISQTASYRFLKLVHDPKVALEGVATEDLIAQLK